MWYLAYGYDGLTTPVRLNLDDEMSSPNVSGADSQPESNKDRGKTRKTGGDDKDNNTKGKSGTDNRIKNNTDDVTDPPRKLNRGPKLYRENDVDWRMFIPPLPQHSGYPRGWVLLSDALLAIPLSVFCQIITISYKIEDLSAYLQHPRKRHLLLRNLPKRMREQLLHDRKYVFAFHELCTRLCYMGLMSFGPQHVSNWVIAALHVVQQFVWTFIFFFSRSYISTY